MAARADIDSLVERLKKPTMGRGHASCQGCRDAECEDAAEALESLASALEEARRERDELERRAAAQERILDRERAFWRNDPTMQRVDNLRRLIAGLDPGGAETLATFQSALAHAHDDAQSAQAKAVRLREIASRMYDEYNRDEKCDYVKINEMIEELAEAVNLDDDARSALSPPLQEG